MFLKAIHGVTRSHPVNFAPTHDKTHVFLRNLFAPLYILTTTSIKSTLWNAHLEQSQNFPRQELFDTARNPKPARPYLPSRLVTFGYLEYEKKMLKTYKFEARGLKLTIKRKKMKTKILKVSVIILLFSLMGAGCEKEELSQSAIDGKWILTGLGDDSSNEYITEPESEPKSSYLVFDKGEMVAYSVTNRTFDMKYVIKEGNKLSIDPGTMTLIGSDTEWGQKFLSPISTIYEFERNGDELKLYYDNQKFMNLKKETK